MYSRTFPSSGIRGGRSRRTGGRVGKRPCGTRWKRGGRAPQHPVMGRHRTRGGTRCGEQPPLVIRTDGNEAASIFATGRRGDGQFPPEGGTTGGGQRRHCVDGPRWGPGTFGGGAKARGRGTGSLRLPVVRFVRGQEVRWGGFWKRRGERRRQGGKRRGRRRRRGKNGRHHPYRCSSGGGPLLGRKIHTGRWRPPRCMFVLSFRFILVVVSLTQTMG